MDQFLSVCEEEDGAYDIVELINKADGEESRAGLCDSTAKAGRDTLKRRVKEFKA